MKTSIATVCLSGTLAEKLHAAASAGFDGVELFEPDLVAAPESPEEIRALAERLGLTLDLYQPIRDVEGVAEDVFADVLRRVEAKFAVMRRLGMHTVLCCSNVATATIDDDEVSAAQLRRLGELAERYDVRIAYEALAWGKYVDDYRRAWRIVQLADHPAVGLCLDSFHVLSRGHDPAAIGAIPGDKIFYLQLADAPTLSMDVLSWSRHHRLFPGEGSFDLAGFVAHTLRAGYRGPLSLEVFNDTFRQTDPGRTAAQALRSLRYLEDRTSALLGTAALRGSELATEHAIEVRSLPDVEAPTAFDFVEVKAEDTSEIEAMLAAAGFTCRGRHRTKPVTLWTSGAARVILNEAHARDEVPHIAAFGLLVEDATSVTARARSLGVHPAHRRTYATEQQLGAAIAPDGTEVYWTDVPTAGAEPRWTREFENGAAPVEGGIARIDHISLTQPWQVIDEAVLFHTAAFALEVASSTDVASPQGLVHSRVMSSPRGDIRIPLNVAPPGLASDSDYALPQHVAFACTDIVAFARQARERGLDVLRMPANYYDDLAARFDLTPERISELRTLDLAYDRDAAGEYLQFYTRTVGRVFAEFVQRVGGYDGFGAGNAPVRLTAQGAARTRAASR